MMLYLKGFKTFWWQGPYPILSEKEKKIFWRTFQLCW